jgi:hypothetical protein
MIEKVTKSPIKTNKTHIIKLYFTLTTGKTHLSDKGIKCQSAEI